MAISPPGFTVYNKSIIQYNMKRENVVKERVYVKRESLLSDKTSKSWPNIVYRIFICLYILLFLYILARDIVKKGRINVGQYVIATGFGKLDKAMCIWAGMQLVSLLVYPLVHIWAGMSPPPPLRRAWDMSWLMIFIVCQILFMAGPMYLLWIIGFPVASALIINLEMVRFMMKMSAFVRTVYPRARSSGMPPFSCYLYFLFAPTLVYRDSYPRTKEIRWRLVAFAILELVTEIFFASVVVEIFIIGPFGNTGLPGHEVTVFHLLEKYAISIVGSFFYICLLNYMIFHTWMNGFAEVVRFGDRQFYLDWWNQTSYNGLYRTWNTIVHDWLYAYIYQEIFLVTKSTVKSIYGVFIVSALFHDIIICFSFSTFFPISSLMMINFSVPSMFLNSKMQGGKFSVLTAYVLSIAIQWMLHNMEYFARVNCPLLGEPTLGEVLLPRLWTCRKMIFG